MNTLQKVQEALEKLARLGNEPDLGNSTGNIIAQKALIDLQLLQSKLESKELVDKVAQAMYCEYPDTIGNPDDGMQIVKFKDSKFKKHICIIQAKAAIATIKG